MVLSPVVGLPGFEPESIEPKSTSLDQASRQPLLQSLGSLRLKDNFARVIKTLTKLQHLSKANQNAIWNRLKCLCKYVDAAGAKSRNTFMRMHAGTTIRIGC